jgi:glycosyltransferase involved in cell wall biosynthesis
MAKVSVIIPFFNVGEYILDSVESIKAQEFPFKNIQVFLIDDGSTDESRLYAKFYARMYSNISYHAQKNKGVSAARNIGIELALQEESEFVFFLDADDKYQKNHIKKCIELLEKYPESIFVSGVMRFFEAENKLNDIYTRPAYQTTREINSLEENTEALYVGHVAQGGWRAASLHDYRFNEDIKLSEDIEFICRILAENKFVFSKEVEYQYRIRYAKDSVVNLAGERLEWYSRVWEVFRPIYADMLEQHGYVPLFMRETIMENLRSLFTPPSKSGIYEKIDYSQLDEALRFILRHTDVSFIDSAFADYWQRMYFYTFKFGEPNLTRWAPLPTFVMNDTGETDAGVRFGYLGTDPLFIHILNEKQGILKIRASIRCFTYKHFELDIKSDFKILSIEETPAPLEREKLFFCGREIFPRKYYEITIDLKDGSAEGLIRFFLTTDYGVSSPVRFDATPLSGLGFNMPFTLGDEFIIKRTKQNYILRAAPFTEKELIEFCPEVKPFGGLGTPQKASADKFNFLKENIINAFRSFAGRRIWLFMDRGSEIGNNAEALFRYCAHKDDGIQKYYIIPDESYIERFAGLPFMIFGTLEYKLLCCFAEKFISSFLFDEGLTLKFGVAPEEKELYEDIRNYKKLARSFFRGDIIHIQHGVIAQDISFYLNKFDEDTRLLFNVSQREYDYVKSGLTYAVEPDILRLTGLPKLDDLERTKNNPNSQKMILFAPSFDRNFNWKDAYQPQYKSSQHFRCLNSILNSPELLDALEQKGYTFWFKPHYALRQQLMDFDWDERINLVPDEMDRYTLYAMADLMITDYSGIAFDFAYLKKPVVYAHFLPNSKFDETYFSYERDGFGEICGDIQALNSVVIEYMQNNCQMPLKYKQRVDSFFSIQDENNCERVYQEILKLPDTRKNIFA